MDEHNPARIPDNIDNCIAFCTRFNDETEPAESVARNAALYECIGPQGRINSLSCGRGERNGPDWMQSDLRWLQQPAEKTHALEEILFLAGFSKIAVAEYIRTLRERTQEGK